jgi:branched-chain amino acid transport system substrate-binding protein
MALEEAGFKSGKFTIKYEDLDDATAAAGQWTAEKEAPTPTRRSRTPTSWSTSGPTTPAPPRSSMPKLNQATCS